MKKILILAIIVFSVMTAIRAQTLTLTNADKSTIKIKKVMGVKYDNCFLKDNEASYSLTGSLVIIKDEKNKKVTTKILVLGNGDINASKETLYAIALNLPETAAKGIYTLKLPEDGSITINPKGTKLDVEYAIKQVTVNITANDGKKISGEINGTFTIINKLIKGQPVIVVLQNIKFYNCSINN